MKAPAPLSVLAGLLVAAVSVLTGTGATVPTVLSLLLVGLIAGVLGITVPAAIGAKAAASSSPAWPIYVLVGIVVAAMTALAGAGIAIPNVLTYALVTLVTGGLGITIPTALPTSASSSSSSTSSSSSSAASTAAPAPAAPAAAVPPASLGASS